MTDANVAKRAAAYAAADLVEDGMTIGLGSGSTFLFVLERLSERIREDGLAVRGAPTSTATAEAATAKGIPLVSLDEVTRLDLAIDGADEVDPDLNLVKGGGGALLREKMVEVCAKKFIVIVDESKLCDGLGPGFPLPVEITQFCWEHTMRKVGVAACGWEGGAGQ